jgi:hypothetical protein
MTGMAVGPVVPTRHPTLFVGRRRVSAKVVAIMENGDLPRVDCSKEKKIIGLV